MERPGLAAVITPIVVALATGLAQYQLITSPTATTKDANGIALKEFALRAKECQIAKDDLYERLVRGTLTPH